MVKDNLIKICLLGLPLLAQSAMAMDDENGQATARR